MELSKKSRRTWEKSLAFFKLLLSSIFALIALRLIFVIIVTVVGVLPKQPHFETYTETDFLFSSLLFAPLWESFLIIGLLWLFNRFTNRQVAMVITALVFGVLHLAPGVTWVVLLMASSLGYLFAYYYYKARSQGLNGYWLIVLIHLITNTLSALPEIVQFLS